MLSKELQEKLIEIEKLLIYLHNFADRTENKEAKDYFGLALYQLKSTQSAENDDPAEHWALHSLQLLASGLGKLAPCPEELDPMVKKEVDKYIPLIRETAACLIKLCKED